MKQIPFSDLKITGGFWAEKQKLNREHTLWAVYEQFMQSGRIPTMNAKPSDQYEVHHFWGSDVVKWMEGAAYLLEEGPDERIEQALDSITDLIEEGTTEDGYYNSYYNAHPELTRFSDRRMHELYSLGHMIEAAIAIYQATGKDRLLKICQKNLEIVDQAFRTEKTAGFTTPGHQEIELALVRLYDLTGEKKYLDLAEFFVRERGKEDEQGMPDQREGNQSHLPVNEQKEAVGHAVRAGYFYCAVADLADRRKDTQLLLTAETLFDDIFNHKMYITGGIGSRYRGEAFSAPYYLPNDAYAETCAALSLALFAGRMSNILPKGKFGDAVERAIYNGMISGLSLDGESFFYTNPLEMEPAERNSENSGKISERVRVFSCSCCPPNLVRMIPSIGNLICGASDEYLYVHQFIPCEGKADGKLLRIETDYPADGRVHIRTEGRKLAVRKPGWCEQFTADKPCQEKEGYLYFDASEVLLDFAMPPVYISAASAVAADQGRLAVMRGPIVYCCETQDQPVSVFRCRVNPDLPIRVSENVFGGLPVLEAQGMMTEEQTRLYQRYRPEQTKPCLLRMIPYYTFANRGEDEMQVWMLK